VRRKILKLDAANSKFLELIFMNICFPMPVASTSQSGTANGRKDRRSSLIDLPKVIKSVLQSVRMYTINLQCSHRALSMTKSHNIEPNSRHSVVSYVRKEG
jgi:hypothetical protein